MRISIIVSAFVTALALLLTQSDIGAGEKKDKDTQPEKKVVNTVIQGELFKADLKDKQITNSYCKTYTLLMEKDKSYEIELRCQNLRPYLRLENAAGQQIAVAFDRFGNQTAAIVHRSTKSEDYQVVVTTQNPLQTGKFTLTV